MRHFFSIALLFCPILSLHAADNWPQFRGPTGDGHAVAKNLPLTWSEKENIRWKTAIHDKGWSSPVIWGDQIWLTTVKEKYPADAPKEAPMKKIPKPDWIEMYAVCVDKSSGKIVHDILLRKEDKPDYCHSFNSYGTPTPVVEAGRVYLHFGSHGTFCVDTVNRQDALGTLGPSLRPLPWPGLLADHSRQIAVLDFRRLRSAIRHRTVHRGWQNRLEEGSQNQIYEGQPRLFTRRIPLRRSSN